MGGGPPPRSPTWDRLFLSEIDAGGDQGRTEDPAGTGDHHRKVPRGTDSSCRSWTRGGRPGQDRGPRMGGGPPPRCPTWDRLFLSEMDAGGDQGRTEDPAWTGDHHRKVPRGTDSSCRSWTRGATRARQTVPHGRGTTTAKSHVGPTLPVGDGARGGADGARAEETERGRKRRSEGRSRRSAGGRDGARAEQTERGAGADGARAEETERGAEQTERGRSRRSEGREQTERGRKRRSEGRSRRGAGGADGARAEETERGAGADGARAEETERGAEQTGRGRSRRSAGGRDGARGGADGWRGSRRMAGEQTDGGGADGWRGSRRRQLWHRWVTSAEETHRCHSCLQGGE